MRHSFFSFPVNPINTFAAFSVALLAALNSSSYADYPSFSQQMGYSGNRTAVGTSYQNAPVAGYASSPAVNANPYAGESNQSGDSSVYSSPVLGEESPVENADNPYAGSSVNYAGEAANSASQRPQYTAAPANTAGRQAASASISGKNRPVVAKIGKKPATSAPYTNYSAPYTNNSNSRQPNSRQTAAAENRNVGGVSPDKSEAKDKKESGSLFSFFGFGSDKTSDKSSDKSEKTKNRNLQNEAALAQQDNVNKNQVKLPDARDEELYTDKSGWWKLKPRKMPDSPQTGNRVVAEQLDVPAASASLASVPDVANSSSSARSEVKENVASQTSNPYSNLNSQPGSNNGAAGNAAAIAAQNLPTNPYAASYSAEAGAREAVQSTGAQPANANSNPYSATAIASNDSQSGAAATNSSNPYAEQTAQAPPRVSRSSSSANVNPYANMTGDVRPTFSADMGNSFAGQTVPRNPYEGIANSAANGNSDIQMPAPPESSAAFAVGQDSTVRRLPPTTVPSTAVAINNNSSVNPITNPVANQTANQDTNRTANPVANNSFASTGADPSLPSLPPLPGDESKMSGVGYSASEGTTRQNIPDTTAIAATSPNADIPPLPGIPPLPDMPPIPTASENAADHLAANGAVNQPTPELPPNPMAATTAAPAQYIASSAEGLDEKALEASNESTRLYSAASSDPETIATNDSQAANWRNQMRATDVPGMSKNFVPVEGAKVWAKVGNEVVLEGDIMLDVNRRKEIYYKTCKEKGENAASEKELEVASKTWEKQALQEAIRNKIIFADAITNIPKENLDMVHNSCFKVFREQHVPVLLKAYEVNSQWELEKQLEEEGSSMERERELFYERTLAAQWMSMQTEQVKEVSYEQIMNYYKENSELFTIKARARWEELVIRKNSFPDRNQAYNTIAEMGMQVVKGKPFAEVAKEKSQGLSASDGGVRDWITVGSLKSKQLEEAIFSQTVGQMSPQIIEDENCFYIIRVVERQDEGKVPFEQAQVEIRGRLKTIAEDNEKEKAYKKMQQNVRVWTVFDGEVSTTQKTETSLF